MTNAKTDPVDAVLADLRKSKAPTHYDEVLALTGALRVAFADRADEQAARPQAGQRLSVSWGNRVAELRPRACHDQGSAQT